MYKLYMFFCSIYFTTEFFLSVYNLSLVYSDSSTQFHWWSNTNIKPRIERLSECGLDCVDEVHCVRDAEEGQSSCTVIHKHSYSPADGLHREISLFVIVPEWVSGGTAVQTPGLIINSKPTLINPPLPADALIWHWYIHTKIISTPLQLPVTGSTHTLSTQYLPPLIKSVWMIRIQLDFVSVRNHSVALRQMEAFIYCVQIQREPMGIWWRQNIRIRNYDSVWSFHVAELFMFSVSSVSQYRLPDICANHNLHNL